MIKIIHHQNGGVNWLLIEVPKDAVNIINTGMGYLTFMVTDYSTWVSDEDIMKIAFGLRKEPKQKVKYNTHNDLDVIPGTPIKLPDGNWQLIGLADQIGEDVAGQIVKCVGFESMVGYGGTYTYEDYTANKGCWSAKESLQTLIASHSLTPQTTVILRQNNQ